MRRNTAPTPSGEQQAQQKLLTRINSLPRSPGQILRSPTTPILMAAETYREAVSMLDDSCSRPAQALLVFVPIAIIAGVNGLRAEVIFFLNFAALVALAGLITFTVLRLSKHAGGAAGVLRGVFGNATELILGITAMRYREIQLVKWIMIGSTLQHSLFVLGGSFLHASYRKNKEVFSKTRTGVMSALVMVTSVCQTIPTIMSIAAKDDRREVGLENMNLKDDTLFLSHITAVVLFVLFLSYLTFRFRTHRQLFPQNQKAPSFSHATQTPTGLPTVTEPPRPLTLILGFVSGIVCAIACANFLVPNIDATIKTLHVTKPFIGVVVLPLAGSLVKAVAIIRYARSEGPPQPGRMSRLDFAIRSIMTNVLDTLLFIMPLLVLLGWVIGQPMVLEFGIFEAVVFLLSMVVMTYLVQHGKTTYFEGIMLMGTYVSIAIAFYVRPYSEATSTAEG